LTRIRLHAADLVPLAIGLAALALGTVFGWDARLVDAVVRPPAIVRAVLVAGAVVLGLVLLSRALRQIGSRPLGEPAATPDMPTMVRGVRLLFLGIAAWATAAGWVVGHPLPIVIALVIAGVDVIETSFLLLVVRMQRG
jgi:hypothetical protein